MDKDTGGGANHQGDVLLLAEEAKGLIAQAGASGAVVRMSSQAKVLSQSPLALGFSAEAIADQLILAAAHAGVPIEIDEVG
jgi:hypothetical protein